MITRPLDLASRLRPLPRGLDALFYVNVGMLAVFFLLFGSRFVLAPGLAVDFLLPQAGGAATARVTTDVVIAVPAANMAVVEGAVLDFKGLGAWLRGQAAVVASGAEAAQAPGSRLLVQASSSLPAKDLAEIYALAADAGFSGVLIATDGAADGVMEGAR
jgi:biopolymer transport protein ExbD